MQLASDTQATLPLALRKHRPAVRPSSEILGDAAQEWTWEPAGDFEPKDLAIYATGGNTTTRQTVYGQTDRGEVY